ncbi:hypothetical protein M9Y10_030323 [Tritrichomonas musculus]|uniref:DUF3447 domain-containing protein n=1 Tax=Tritrichomonas musculus TaxID=1915356 RepID=A0ABR2KQP0_9EUKA
MEIQEHLEKMTNIYDIILKYIDSHDELDYIISELSNYCQSLENSKSELKEFLQLIVKIYKHHHHVHHFFTKIDHILLIFKESIQKHLSNLEIFDIFKKCKRILLFLVEEKVLIINKYVALKMLDEKYNKYTYAYYFYPEIKHFFDISFIEQNCEMLNYIQELIQDDFESFKQKRKKGENDLYICELIRKDLLDEFIIYSSKTNLKLSKIIDQSIFETNQYLINNQPSLIEYSAFCGAVQILKYLYMNQIRLEPNLWLYAIHGNNAELIHFLEENNKIPFYLYKKCLDESIKCHHNEIANYIINCAFDNFDNQMKYQSILSYNYNYFPSNVDHIETFYYLCLCNNAFMAEMILNTYQIDITSKINDKSFLYLSVEKGNYDIVELLLNNPKVDVNEKYIYEDYDITKEEKAPIHVAAEKKYNNILKLLLKSPKIDVNAKNILLSQEKEEKTSLHIAVETGNSEAVLLLLACPEIDVNIKYIYAETQALSYKKWHFRISPYLTGYYYYEEKTALHLAVEKENLEIAQLLLSKSDIDVNDQTHTFMRKCVSTTDFEENEEEKTALHLAVEKNNPSLIMILLASKNINVNIKDEKGRKPIQLTDDEKIKALLNRCSMCNIC